MDKEIDAPTGFTDRPPHEANLPMTEDQQVAFTKFVKYWSSDPESSEQSETATAEYMGEFAPHRAVTRVVKTRSSSKNGVQYVRGGVTVVSKSADDFASLRVERRQPTDDSEVDEVTSTEYVMDGPDWEVAESKWLVDRESGERVVKLTKDELVDDFAPMLAVGERLEEDSGATVDIVLPDTPDDDSKFTRGRAWETEDIFTELAEEGWVRSPVEHKITPRAPQEG